MTFNNQIKDMIKAKSGLSFEKTKDYNALCDNIYSTTNRTIGVNTLKRLMGYINDDRNTNDYTLNTIAIYLSFKSWEELCCSIRIDSEWNYDDQTVYVDDLALHQTLIVKYLNRTITFEVVMYNDKKMLQVVDSVNSSLKNGDVLTIQSLRVGKILEAQCVYRGSEKGNYKTNGELKEIIINDI